MPNTQTKPGPTTDQLYTRAIDRLSNALDDVEAILLRAGSFMSTDDYNALDDVAVAIEGNKLAVGSAKMSYRRRYREARRKERAS